MAQSHKVVALGVAMVVLAAALAAGARSSRSAFPGTPGKIAFQTYRKGNFEIYVMNANGSGARNLTRRTACDALPAWSPEGKRIAWERTTRGGSSRLSEIWVMTLTGSGRRQLTKNKVFDGDPAWSPDGRWIVFESERDGNSEIYVMEANGRNQRRLTNNRAFDGDPAWSPGGRRIAFTSERDGNLEIYLMDPDGSSLLNITRNPANDIDPTWSPSGALVGFSSDRDGNFEIYTTNDRLRQTRLTAYPALDALPAWSPKGDQIVFVSDRAGGRNRDVFTMTTRGTSVRRLTKSSGWDVAPDWQALRRASSSVAPLGFLKAAARARPRGGLAAPSAVAPPKACSRS